MASLPARTLESDRRCVTMAEVDRFRPEDRRSVEALYRRVFGNDAADASRLRWDWQYRRNPNNPDGHPDHLARTRRSEHHRAVRDDAGAAVGARPGGAGLVGHRRDGGARNASGRASARCSSARGTGTSARHWVSGCRNPRINCSRSFAGPKPGPVPCLVKPLTRRAFRRPELAGGRQSRRVGPHAAR